MGVSPCLTMDRLRMEISGPTMQPRTERRRRSPARLARKPLEPARTNPLFSNLSRSKATKATRTLVEEELDTAVGEDTLHHGETLLVVAAGDAEDVAGELFTEVVALDLLGHAHVVKGGAGREKQIRSVQESTCFLLHDTYSFFSSSISITFIAPKKGLAMLSCPSKAKEAK